MKAAHAALAWAAVVATVLALTACGPKQATRPATQAKPIPVTAYTEQPLLTPLGWGRVKVGMSHNLTVAALGNKVRPDNGVHDEAWANCHEIQPQDISGVIIMVEHDRVTRISLLPSATGVITDKGVRVGDPESAVRAAYPTGLSEAPHKYAQAPAKYLTWWQKRGVAGVRYTIGHDGLVAAIAAGSGAIEYVEGCS